MKLPPIPPIPPHRWTREDQRSTWRASCDAQGLGTENSKLAQNDTKDVRMGGVKTAPAELRIEKWVREIAEGAGVTAMLVNRYFGSKEGLFAEALAATMASPTSWVSGKRVTRRPLPHT